MTELLPERLGERFVLGQMIGRGTCSQVHRAHDLLLDRAAAVKIFPVADDPRVEREVSLLASLDHPSLVGVYDVGQYRGRAFVVMALFEGGSLADRLRFGPLPLGETILAVSAIADALAHVHRAGVLHRDVTPRNILFDVDGRAHLSDFGVAFVADSPRITDTGIVVGSAPYLAPEQVRGDEVGPPADIYGLALVMLEALTARPAYTGTPLEAAVARLETLPRIPPGLGDDLTDLLVEMTADDPAERPDAESVRLRLRRAALAREVGTPSGPQRVVTAADLAAYEPPRLPTRALMVVGAAAMSVLLAGTVVVASTWTVHDVASSSNPPASLSPTASTPLGRALPAAAPDGGDGGGSGSDESRSRSSSSDSGRNSSEPAGRFWSAVAASRSEPPLRADRGALEQQTPRRTAGSSPQLSAPPTSTGSESGSGDDSDDPTTGRSASTHETAPTTSSSTPDGDDGSTESPRSAGLLPDLGDVTKDLPSPLGRGGNDSGSSQDSGRSASPDTPDTETPDTGTSTPTTTRSKDTSPSSAETTTSSTSSTSSTSQQTTEKRSTSQETASRTTTSSDPTSTAKTGRTSADDEPATASSGVGAVDQAAVVDPSTSTTATTPKAPQPLGSLLGQP